MKKQGCVNCGHTEFTEVIITMNFKVTVEEDGFADCNGDSKYPEPYYVCDKCETEHMLVNGVLHLKTEG